MILPDPTLKIESACAKKTASRPALEEPFLSTGEKAGEVYLVALDGKMLLAVPVDPESCREDTPGYVPAWALKEARRMRKPELKLEGEKVETGTMEGPRNPNSHTPPNWRQALPPERKEKSLRLDVDRLAALAKAFGSSVVDVYFRDVPEPEVKEVLRVKIPRAPEGTIALLMPAPTP